MADNSNNANTTSSTATRGRRYHAPQPGNSQVVSRPVPQGQINDPREFQLGQIRRRYSPREQTKDDGATILIFKLAPSDPDFPYEMQALECTLTVPNDFPTRKESLRVTNAQMGRGYQINVENGFDGIVRRTPSATILQHINALDRELESFLATPKAETVKIVAHPSRSRPAESNQEISVDTTSKTVSEPVKEVAVYTSEQLAQARQRRETECRKIEGRLGRLPLFSKHRDGKTYTIPLQPQKRNELPECLREIRSIDLVVPDQYNLVPCMIEFPGVIGEEVVVVQDNFKEMAQANSTVSLFAHINRLAQSIHTLAKPPSVQRANSNITSPAAQTMQAVQDPISKTRASETENDRSHIVVIPRPPEWNTTTNEEGEDDSEFSSFDSEEDSGVESDGAPQLKDTSEEPSTPERGIMMSFPNLELYSIELMELTTLSITVKCDRCKEITDVTSLRDSAKAESGTTVKSVSCKKCANKLSIGYRMDLMHANCVRAGYLDLDGCTVIEMLPSYFTPTCSECSTPVPSPGIVSVRGDSSMAICRECHKRMSFKIPEVKFLRVISAAAVRASQAPRKKREQLGIRAGEQLPNRGRCSHYSKSYRWFRFSCCNKVFPCDRCHDAVSDHPNEHANRMICGYCSREQNYRPEDCHICHASLTAKKGTGFWEGGKGTRDKTRMSRKDPRKYKRRPGTVVKDNK